MASGINKDKYRFDTELLITEIEQRPCIWDTSSEEYKNRDVKNKAWEEVAEMLLQDDTDQERKQEAIKLIQQRWKSARDAYRRDRSKLKTSKSGQAAKSFKKYIYFENLKILNKTLDLNDTETNLHEEESENLEDVSDNEDTVTESIYDESQGRVNAAKYKRKKTQSIDQKLMEFLDNSNKADKNDNGNRAFLESLLPTLDTFDEAKSLQFRAEVLRIMMEIKNIPSIANMHSFRDNSQSLNFTNRRLVPYSQYDNNNYLGGFPTANLVAQQYVSNSPSGHSDLSSRPQSSASYISSPPPYNPHVYSPTVPHDYLHSEIHHDATDRPTLMELTGVNVTKT